MKLLVALALALAGCGPVHPVTPPIVQPSSEDVALGKRVDAAIDQALAAKTIVGTVVVIARDGKVVYLRAAGLADREANRPMREDTIFRIASMTKPIVSATALALVDQGVLGLDDPVTKYLPEFRPKLADGKEPVITIRQLLTHTSGLDYKFLQPPGGSYDKAEVSDGLAEPGLAMEENLRRIASVPLINEPGTTWHYSLSVDVLGAVIARAGGGTLPALVTRLVTGPLEMTDTTFVVTDKERLAFPYAPAVPPIRMTDPHDVTMEGLTVRFSPARIFDPASYPSGGAGLAATASDYLRFAEALRTGGAPVLRPETMQAMAANQIGDRPVDFFGPGWGFGFGLGVVTDPVAAKSPLGQGTFTWSGIYGTQFWVDPTTGLSVVVMTDVALGTGLDLIPAVYGK